MKKLICIIAALAMCVVFPLAGCGGDETADVKAAADGFMSALQEGDIEKAKEFADPAIFEEGGSLYAFSTIDNMDEELAEAMGVKASDLSDKTKETMDNFVNDVLKSMIKSYEIKDVTIDDEGVGKVNVSTTFGFDPDKIADIDVNDQVEKKATDYMTGHMAELTELYNSGGETAIINKVFEDLAPELLGLYKEEMMKTGEVTQDTVLTVKNMDGKWLVTEEETK